MGQALAIQSAALPTGFARPLYHNNSTEWSIRTSFDDTDVGPDVFSRLPPEVLDTLIDYLDFSSLRNCTFVNSAFYNEIKRRLCRRVRLQVDGFHGDVKELKFVGEKVDRRKLGFQTHQQENAALYTGISRPAGFEPEFCTRWIKHWIGDYVRCLDIDAHDSSRCACMDPMTENGRAVQSHVHHSTWTRAIRLNFENVGGRSLFHTDGNPNEEQAICNVIDLSWNPATLVLRNFPAYFRGVTGLVRGDPLHFAQSIVYLLGPMFLGAHGTPRDTLYLHTIAPAFLTDSIVVFTSMPGEPFTPMLAEHEHWDDVTCARWFDRLLCALVTSYYQVLDQMRTIPDSHITIVNAGSIPTKYLGASAPQSPTPKAIQDTIEGIFRKYVQALLPPNAVSRYSKIKTGEGIRFLSMKQYVNQDGRWSGRYYLDGDMVAAWDAAVEED